MKSLSRTEARYRTLQWLVASASALPLLLGAHVAAAQSTIREPGNHPAYVAEIEPHFSLGLFPPPGPADGFGYGFGLRGTIPLMHNGFVSTINNSIGISFGFDWLHYEGNDVALGPCAHWNTGGPGGTRTCTAVGDPYGGPANYLFFPVAMQWNFWLSDKFSTFAEPGIALYYAKGAYESHGNVGGTPVFDLGGRWHFMRLAQLTLRFGYPMTTLGVSFMF